MSRLDSSRPEDVSHADMPHASPFSELDGDMIPDSNSRGNHHDMENSEPNPNSESMESQSEEQPPAEQAQNLYYTRGLEEIESLQLLDLSPLATWALSSHKQGHGLQQLRDDSPETYWQSDGSTENSVEQVPNSDNTQLNHPHSISLQFSKKVSLERISIFINYQLDESYTPSKIKIMAGGSNWDLTEVCVVDFENPVGWSHIVFKGVRGDGLLKCFVVKIIILANHQDGKDSHIRAIRCLGKKSNTSSVAAGLADHMSNIAQSSSGDHSASGISLNHQEFSRSDLDRARPLSQLSEVMGFRDIGESKVDQGAHGYATSQILSNVDEVLGFNSGFKSRELKSISSIR